MFVSVFKDMLWCVAISGSPSLMNSFVLDLWRNPRRSGAWTCLYWEAALHLHTEANTSSENNQERQTSARMTGNATGFQRTSTPKPSGHRRSRLRSSLDLPRLAGLPRARTRPILRKTVFPIEVLAGGNRQGADLRQLWQPYGVPWMENGDATAVGSAV